MILTKYISYTKNAVITFVYMVIFILNNCAIGEETIIFHKVDQNIVPDELAMLANTTRANYEKIKTWQGNITFDSTLIYRGTYASDIVKKHAGIAIESPNELAEQVEGTKEFKIDLINNLSFRTMNRSKPMEYINLDKSINYSSLEGSVETTKIITSEYEFESSPYAKKKDGTILSRLAEKRLRKQNQLDFDESDPRYCFSIGKPAWVLLSEFSKGVHLYNQDPNGIIGKMPNNFYGGIALEKAQTTKGVIYRMQFIIPGAVDEKITFDGDKGLNPTYVEVKNGKGIKISEITRDFIKIQGVFLPSEQQEVQYDGEDGRLRRQAKSTFSDMQVNMALPENTFTVNNLGLKDGDKFIDKIEGKEYRYQDANLISVAEPNK